MNETTNNNLESGDARTLAIIANQLLSVYEEQMAFQRALGIGMFVIGLSLLSLSAALLIFILVHLKPREVNIPTTVSTIPSTASTIPHNPTFCNRLKTLTRKENLL